MKSGSPEKKKTLKLNIEQQQNLKVIGISSHENDYRLVWAINDVLKMQFVRTGNLIIHDQKLNTDLEFSRYMFQDEDRYLKWFLIANRCPDGFLFPDVRNFDFILQIAGEISEPDIKVWVKKLKAVTVISAVFQLQPEKIKGMYKILG